MKWLSKNAYRRQVVRKLDLSPEWADKVEQMDEKQLAAIYFRIKMGYKPKRKPKIDDGEQLSMF